MVKQILQFPMLDLIFIKICFGVRLIISSRRFVFLLTTQTYCLSCFISIKCLSVNLLVWAVFCTSVWGKCADSIFSSWNLLNWKCCKSNTFHSHTSILNLYFTKHFWKDFLKRPGLVYWNLRVYIEHQSIEH